MALALTNVGLPRSVNGHVISGALASGMVAGALNYNQYKKEKITQEQAIKDSIKLTLQGGIATGSAIAASNALGRKSFLGMLSAVTIGIAGIYGVEKLYEKVSKTAEKASEIEEGA